MKKVLALLSLLAGVALTPAHALDIQPYSAQLLQTRQAAGEAVSLHFHATWCSICRAQEKVFQTFKGDTSVPGTLLVVDYDDERQLRRELGVRSQSTLIVYKGKAQTHRSGGETDPQKLRAAFLSAR